MSAQPRICPRCSAQYPPDVAFCAKDGTRLIAGGQRDLAGTVIAERYRVIERLGEGGMGQVWLAEHVRMKRKSAIKVLRPALVGEPDALQRFTREAENASQISHPNVAQVYDFGETADGLVYLAMEFIDGEPLSAKLKREHALHPDVAADVIGQAADALAAAHGLGILHRDLKPDNIMLGRRGDGTFQVKLVDFGIARTMDAGDQKVTRTGFAVGTPEYMSPEQIAGESLDARSDLYSLALVAFVALTGKDAFPAGSSKESLVARLTSRPRTLQSAKEDVDWPPALQDVFDRALSPEPDERYAHVEQFAADLGAAISAMTPTQTAALYRKALEARLVSVTLKTPHSDLAVATPVTPHQATPLPPEAQRRRAGTPSGQGPAVDAATSGMRPRPPEPVAEPSQALVPAEAEARAVVAVAAGAPTPAPATRRGPLVAGAAVAAAVVIAAVVWRARGGAPPLPVADSTAVADTAAPATPVPPPGPAPAPAAGTPATAAAPGDRAATDSVRLRARAAADSGRRAATAPARDTASPRPTGVRVTGTGSPFPEAAILAAFSGAPPDYRAHTVRGGPVRALVMTPVTLAWRARQAAAWKSANPRPDVGIPYDVVDPIEVWSGWKPTLRARRAVAVVEVTAADAPFPRYAPADAIDLAKGDVATVEVRRNGDVVPVLDLERIPAVVNAEALAAQGRAPASAVVFALRPDVFAPDAPGGATPTIELAVTAGGKRTRLRLDGALARRLHDEFAPWRDGTGR